MTKYKVYITDKELLLDMLNIANTMVNAETKAEAGAVGARALGAAWRGGCGIWEFVSLNSSILDRTRKDKDLADLSTKCRAVSHEVLTKFSN